MKMMPIIAIAFGLGFVLILFQMVGVSALFETSHTSTPIEGEVQDATAQAEEQTADPEENTGFFSYVGSALSTARTALSVVAFLPAALESIGLPEELAWLVGRSSQMVLVFGMVQIALQWEVR